MISNGEDRQQLQQGESVIVSIPWKMVNEGSFHVVTLSERAGFFKANYFQNLIRLSPACVAARQQRLRALVERSRMADDKTRNEAFQSAGAAPFPT